MRHMLRATMVMAAMGLAAAAARSGEPDRYIYDVVWREPGVMGFSAPNALRDGDAGPVSALVACAGNTGVVCFSLDGKRLWTYPLTPPVTAAPAVADVDGDGAEDIVAGDSVGTLVALRADGALLWKTSVPDRIMADSCPAIADLDGDGRSEVLVGDAGGTLSCVDYRGRLRWQFTGDGSRMGPALVADIYDAPGAEIIVTSHDSHIYALTARGEWLWDLYFQDDLFPNSTPILADVDGNAVPELYIGGGLHHFYAIDLEKASVALEKNVYLHVNNCIAAGDVNGDGLDEVVFGNKGGGLWCYGKEGFLWTQQFGDSGFYAAPTFADLDGDPQLEIVMPSVQGNALLLDADGTLLLKADTGCKATAAPLAGDLDGDGKLDLAVSDPGEMSGEGMLMWVDLGVPYTCDGRNAATFAGNRARSGRPPQARAYPVLPAPALSEKQEERASVVDNPVLLTGANTFRFDVSNPDRRRHTLLVEMAYPDGTARRFARHVFAAEERVAVAFEAHDAGTYELKTRLVDAGARVAYEPAAMTLEFGGFPSDQRYLDEVVFAETQRCLESWRASNPRCADALSRELAVNRGLLAQLADEEPARRTALLTSLRTSADRLRALAAASSALAPSGSFFAWEFCPWAYFDPGESLPTAEDRTEKLEASLCIGEYESLALNLTNVCERSLDVRVLLSNQPAPEGFVPLPAAACVELRRAVMVPEYQRAMVADALPLLDQASIVNIAPFESQQLWITVNAKGLAAGKYAAQVRLKSIEPDPTELLLPLELTVHDLALPRPRPLRFCMWAYDGGPLGTDRPEVLSALVEHGATVFFGTCPQAQCDKDGNLTGPLDFTAHDESVARLSPHGFLLFVSPQGHLQGAPFLSEPWRKAFAAYVRAWASHMAELGVDPKLWALYPYDEPSAPYAETTINLVEVAKLIREANPDVLIYADPTSGTTMESVEMYKGLIDIWCPSSELLSRLGSEMLPVAREHATEIWYYDAPGRAKTLSTLSHYRRWIWYAWNQGFTGAGWWVFAHHGDADRWDGPNTTGNFYATAYDSPHGVVTSRRWEATREGIEDYEYLYLLRGAIRDAEARGVAEGALAGFKKLLDEMPPSMEETLRATGRRLRLSPDSVPAYEEATQALQDARQRIVDACLALKE
ncbi:MAG TPA: FG-GAP-like repeat-containing protein [Candidatus Hydrogenedentes bacterium]|nr:FG-GAP-like repeat-containing protein [Candidatus Hydrogenedentota bacterium]